MLRIRFFPLVAFGLAWFSNSNNLLAEEHDALLMPRELVQVAAENDCVQVAGFYDRPGIMKPAFVYGQIGAVAESVAAFWCERAQKSDATDFRLIVIAASASAETSRCAAVLEWWNYPGGLSIESLARFGADGYRNMADHEVSEIVSNGNMNVLVGEYDGVTSVFVCDEGGWKYRIYH